MTKDELKNFNLLYLKGYAECVLGEGDVSNDDPRELTRMLQGSKKYTCPFCGSGDGERGTPAFTVYSDHYYCYSCHKRGDIFDLIAKVEKIPHMRAVFKRAEELFKDGNDDELVALKKWLGDGSRESGEPFVKPDYSSYIAECHAAVNQTDFWAKRGISARSIEHFRLGYDPKLNSVVIPYGEDNSYYMQRSVEGKRYYKRSAKEAGPEPIFNLEALLDRDRIKDRQRPIFVCEGQIDAISFYEVGYDAIAIGGTNGIKKLISQIREVWGWKYYRDYPVLVLDNDDPGRKAQFELSRSLVEIRMHHAHANVYGDYKDANEAFLKDRSQFEAAISNVVRNVAEDAWIYARSV